MRGFFKILQKDGILLWSFWISIFMIFLATGGIIASYTSLPPVIPLYNHMPWGYARLGRSYELLILPITILCILFLNSFLGIKLLGKVPLLARFLFLTMIALSLFMLIFVARLIFITL